MPKIRQFQAHLIQYRIGSLSLILRGWQIMKIFPPISPLTNSSPQQKSERKICSTLQNNFVCDDRDFQLLKHRAHAFATNKQRHSRAHTSIIHTRRWIRVHSHTRAKLWQNGWRTRFCDTQNCKVDRESAKVYNKHNGSTRYILLIIELLVITVFRSYSMILLGPKYQVCSKTCCAACICVWVCVWEREREREREIKTYSIGREWVSNCSRRVFSNPLEIRPGRHARL